MKEICEFSIGQEVFARNYCGEMKWRKGEILICEGPLINQIQIELGVIWRRHIEIIASNNTHLNRKFLQRSGNA